MSLARSWCDRPETSIRRFDGPRSSQCCGRVSVWVTGASIPGSGATSVVVIGRSGSSIRIAFLVLLARAGDGKRAGRDVFRDDRSRGNPSTVANFERSNERILDPGPDVPADRGASLRLAGLVGEVGRDVPRSDVRAGADVRVADVREVRHLRALADSRVLDLHECARLRARLEDRAGAKVTEWADEHTRPDFGVHGDRVRPDLGTFTDARPAAQDRKWMDRRVRRQLDVGVDPR